MIICDVHPIEEGHVLIIPKQHISSVGAYGKKIFLEFENLYGKVSKFLKDTYGSIATFEHGKIGQTVYHSHVHLLPFKGRPIDIIPEGKSFIIRISDLSELLDIFRRYDKYLFFSINKNMWVVDVKLGVPRFFRDRFAQALGVPENGNWKVMHEDKKLMDEALKDIANLEKKWKKYHLF